MTRRCGTLVIVGPFSRSALGVRRLARPFPALSVLKAYWPHGSACHNGRFPTPRSGIQTAVPTASRSGVAVAAEGRAGRRFLIVAIQKVCTRELIHPLRKVIPWPLDTRAADDQDRHHRIWSF